MKVGDITNSIVSASATIIALVALATGIYQARLSHDQAKAAVWPYLIQGHAHNNGYAYVVQNVGVGPAIIRSFEVEVNGKIAKNWKDVAELMGLTLNWNNKRSTTFQAGLVLPASSPVVELIELPDTADARQFSAHASAMQTKICFCSLYGDCWENRSDAFDSRPVKACKEDPARRFTE
jgi:hypothetical protein